MGEGRAEADFRAEPRGNHEPVLGETDAAGEVARGDPGFPAPFRQAGARAADTLRDPLRDPLRDHQACWRGQAWWTQQAA